MEDKDLIEDYFGGNEHALEVLIDRYAGSVYNFLIRFTGMREVDDLVQETFVKMWRHLRSFKPEKKFSTWLLSIARNSAIDYLRKNKKELPFSHFDSEEGDFAGTLEEEHPEKPEDIFDSEIDVEKAYALIGKLPAAEQTVLLLRIHYELSFQEIAEIVGEPLNTVKSRYRRTILLLQKQF